jgi:hypothetical protein
MENGTEEKDSSSNVELEYACVILNRPLTEELFLKIGVTIGESLDVRPSVSHVTDGRLSRSKLYLNMNLNKYYAPKQREKTLQIAKKLIILRFVYLYRIF